MRIILCEQDKVKQYHLGVATVLDVIGHTEALVTDKSTLYDFLECMPSDFDTLNELRRLAYGRPVNYDTYIWELGSWIEGE